MKYHLERAHPRTGRDERPTRLDPGTSEAVREIVTLLEEARENVFAEPLRSNHLIERARELALWIRDRSRPRPPPHRPASVDRPSPSGGRRHIMGGGDPKPPQG